MYLKVHLVPICYWSAKVRSWPKAEVLRAQCNSARTGGLRYFMPSVVAAISKTSHLFRKVTGAPRRFAIRTVPKETPCDAIVEHLRSQMHRMSKRGLRSLQSGTWAPPERFHNFDLSQPSLLVPRIAKTPKAVRLPVGILPLNHNLSIVSGGPVSLKLVERALQSEVAAEWMRDHAPRLEGGYYSLCTTLLRKMPVDLS